MATLGSASGLNVGSYTGFDYPGFAQIVDLLGDETSSKDQVLQSGGTPLQQATISGVEGSTNIGYLRGYNLSKESVSWSGGGDSLYVRVLTLTVTQTFAGVYLYSAVLIEAAT